MGSVYGDNQNLLLYNASGGLIYTPPFPFSKVGDFGSARFQKYWLEATIHDLVNQPWTADGVFIDVVPFRPVQLSAGSVKYNTDQKWATAQHSFIKKIVTGLGEKNQKIITNTRLQNQVDFNNYIISDNSAAPPYGMLNEGAFAVPYGLGDVQFFVESYWKMQIDLMSQVDNINTLYLSHSELSEGDSGTDNWGKPVIFRDILWYAMGSYHIGKNTISNNNYWSLTRSYGRALWFDEYDHIDLGDAIGEVTDPGQPVVDRSRNRVDGGPRDLVHSGARRRHWRRLHTCPVPRRCIRLPRSRWRPQGGSSRHCPYRIPR